MIALADTRRVARPQPPAVPDGWTEHEVGLWSWVSSGRTVTASVQANAEGELSAPHVSGVGRFWLVTTELERACRAVEALCTYLRARHTWRSRHG